jgi:hypothetical protein
MPPQTLSKKTPSESAAPLTDGVDLYSSFEHFEPGLQFLSNDPVSEDNHHVLWQQEQQQKQQLPQDKDTAPLKDTATKLRDPGPNDPDFVDLLYVVNPAGETSVTNLTSPAPAPPAPSPSAATDQYALPTEHDDPSQTAYLPPLSAAFNQSSTKTTIIAGSGSARALLGPELDLEEANELDYEARLMSWWPKPEEDELKVERM